MTKINKKISFISRGYRGEMPQVDEYWLVRVVGENPKGTVFFVEPIEKLHYCERCHRGKRLRIWQYDRFYHTSEEKRACDTEYAEKKRVEEIAASLAPNEVWVEGGKGINSRGLVIEAAWWVRVLAFNDDYADAQFVGPEAASMTKKVVELKTTAHQRWLERNKEVIDKFPVIAEGGKAALDWARGKFTVECLPDSCEYRVDIYGTHKIVAIHNYPGVADDAWGVKVSVDEVIVKSSAIPFAEDEEDLIAEYSAKVTKFFHLEKEQEEEYYNICEALERAGIVDVNDYRGTSRLMAYYAVSPY